jgi:hypothetical protein
LVPAVLLRRAVPVCVDARVVIARHIRIRPGSFPRNFALEKLRPGEFRFRDVLRRPWRPSQQEVSNNQQIENLDRFVNG